MSNKGYRLSFYIGILASSALASGTGQALGASLPGLCFHLIILTALSLPSEGGYKRLGLCRGQVVIADVVSSKHMFSPYKVHVAPLKVW